MFKCQNKHTKEPNVVFMALTFGDKQSLNQSKDCADNLRKKLLDVWSCICKVFTLAAYWILARELHVYTCTLLLLSGSAVVPYRAAKKARTSPNIHHVTKHTSKDRTYIIWPNIQQLAKHTSCDQTYITNIH